MQPVIIWTGPLLSFFPLSDLKFGPRMSSADSMSALLMGKSGSIFPFIYPIQSLVLGKPMMSLMDWALQESE